MKPTDILSDEHRVIEQVLDCLERMVEQPGVDRPAGRPSRPGTRSSSSACLPTAAIMARKRPTSSRPWRPRDFRRNEGPTGVMLHEHELGRGHVRAMDERSSRRQPATRPPCGQFGEHALAYVDLLREHIRKEDHCLFAMANQVFSQSDQE